MVTGLIEADLGVAFADLGSEMVYRVVSTTVDVDAGTVTETWDDRDVVGLVGTVRDEGVEPAGEQTRGAKLQVLVRSEELPADCPALTDRVIVRGEEYAIEEFRYMSEGGLFDLAVRRR